MISIKLTEDNELDLTNGLEMITDYVDIAEQRIRLSIGLNLAEWFADATFGLPWLQIPGEDFSESIRYMLGDKFPDTPRFIASTLDNYLTSQEYISSVSSTYTFDNKSRVFTYSVTIVLVEGGILNLTPFITEL